MLGPNAPLGRKMRKWDWTHRSGTASPSRGRSPHQLLGALERSSKAAVSSAQPGGAHCVSRRSSFMWKAVSTPPCLPVSSLNPPQAVFRTVPLTPVLTSPCRRAKHREHGSSPPSPQLTFLEELDSRLRTLAGPSPGMGLTVRLIGSSELSSRHIPVTDGVGSFLRMIPVPCWLSARVSAPQLPFPLLVPWPL